MSKSSDKVDAQFSGTIRVEKNRNYSTLSNVGLHDIRMTFPARGLLAFLLTMPDSWEIKVKHLITQSPQGRDAIYTMLRELKKFGYLVRTRKKGVGGRFEWETVLYEVPPTPQSSDDEPDSGDDDTSPEHEPSESQSSLPARAQTPSPDTGAPYTEIPYMDEPDTDEADTGTPHTDAPDTEKADIYKELSEQSLSEQRLKERETEGVREKSRELAPPQRPPARPRRRPEPIFSTEFDDDEHEPVVTGDAAARDAEASAKATNEVSRPSRRAGTLPDWDAEPDMSQLATICSVNRAYPSALDCANWDAALQTVRDTTPTLAPAERVALIKIFRERFCTNGRQRAPYLSQIPELWPRMMHDLLLPLDGAASVPVAETNAERMKRLRAKSYGSGSTQRTPHGSATQ